MKDVLDNSNKELFNVISTFAGGGGSSTGYRLAGGKILLINEFVEEARKTYRENYPNTKILPDDIKNLTGDDILKEVNLKVGELNEKSLLHAILGKWYADEKTILKSPK